MFYLGAFEDIEAEMMVGDVKDDEVLVVKDEKKLEKMLENMLGDFTSQVENIKQPLKR